MLATPAPGSFVLPGPLLDTRMRRAARAAAVSHVVNEYMSLQS